jgi:hypothetical protein
VYECEHDDEGSKVCDSRGAIQKYLGEQEKFNTLVPFNLDPGNQFVGRTGYSLQATGCGSASVYDRFSL